MKRKILIITLAAIMAITVAFALSGCSFIENLLGKGFSDKSSMAAPTGLRLEERTLTWSSVKDATQYEVEYVVNGKSSSETVMTNSFTFPEDAYGEISVKVKAKNASESSSYSVEVKDTLYVTLVLDLSAANISVNGDEATLSFPAVTNASSYSARIKEAAGEWTETQSATPSFTISSYKKNYSYYFQITAVGEGYFKTSAAVNYVVDAEPDFTDADTVDVDLSSDTKAVFAAQGAQRVKINDVAVPTEYVAIKSNEVEVAYEYLNSLDLGVAEVCVFDESSVMCYYLDLDDSRAPVITFDGYVKDGESAKGKVENYHNVFSNVSKNGATVSSTFYYFENGDLYFKGSYLDGLLEGTQIFSYNYTRGNTSSSVSFSIAVSTAVAELKTTRYVYTGDDVSLKISTHGDTITNVKNNGSFLSKGTDYTVDKNSLVIKASYLAAHGEPTFTIYSIKGLSQEITVTQQLNGFVPAKTVYDFDKNDDSNLTVSGVLHNNSFAIYGEGITNSDYGISGGNVTILYSFLDSLGSGNKRFMVECEGYYSYFTVNIFDADAAPYEIKFNFDIDSNAYLTFVCDCGSNDHVYSIDGGSNKGCVSPQKIDSLLRTVDHSVVVKCNATGNESYYDFDGVPGEALTYMNTRVTAMGKSQDLFVDSVEELAFIIKYCATADVALTYEEEYPFGKASITCYYSDAFKAYTKNNDGYLRKALTLSDVNGIKVGLSGLGNEYTVSVGFSSRPEPDAKSGTTKAALADNRVFLTNGSRANDFDAFPINDAAIEEYITLESELDKIPLGVKPLFKGDCQAKSVYEAALTVCRTYISDDMSDYEKVIAIYHYLTSAITYDENALTLYEVSDEAEAATNLAAFKNYLTGVIESNPSLFAILDPLRSYSSLEDVRKYMQAKLNSLRSFALSGALLDNVAVCDGISSAFKLLCLIEGIDCIKVSGLGITGSGTQKHAWNKVKIDGDWYVVDATWGRMSDYVNHSYLLIPEEEALSSHAENVTGYGELSVVDILAEGNYDFYASEYMTVTILGVKYDMKAESEEEFLATFSALKKTEATVLEFKLDFDYGNDLSSLIGKTNTSCSFYKINGGVLVILN